MDAIRREKRISYRAQILQIREREQTEHPREGNTTFCNFAVQHAAGIGPRSYGSDDFEQCKEGVHFTLGPGAARVISGSANEIYAKLDNPKTRGPWVEILPSEAQDIANEGGFTFGVQKNRRGPHGHIAMVIPETRASRDRVYKSEHGTAARPVGGPVIGNVGGVNRDRPASHAFAQPPASTKARFFTEVSTIARVRQKKEAEFRDLDFEFKDDRNFLGVAWDYYTGK